MKFSKVSLILTCTILLAVGSAFLSFTSYQRQAFNERLLEKKLTQADRSAVKLQHLEANRALLTEALANRIESESKMLNSYPTDQLLRAEINRLEDLVGKKRAAAASKEVEVQATAKLDRDEKISQETKRFRTMRFSYSRPKDLPYGKSTKLILSIGSANPIDAKHRAMQGGGKVQSAEAMLGDNVRASLEGPEQLVDIQLADTFGLASIVKPVTSSANVSWAWYVTPKTLDPVTLTLTIFNEVEIDGELVELEGPAYTDTFTINASLWDRWSATVSTFWSFVVALVATLAAIVTAGIEYLKWRKDAKSPPVVASKASVQSNDSIMPVRNSRLKRNKIAPPPSQEK